MSFVRHESAGDARQFIEAALSGWDRNDTITYLAFSKEGGQLVGSTGIVLETPLRAYTGYVLARDAWGRGLATEMARAMVDVAFAFPKLWRLFAICHANHLASERVLLKVGFQREGILRVPRERERRDRTMVNAKIGAS